MNASEQQKLWREGWWAGLACGAAIAVGVLILALFAVGFFS